MASETAEQTLKKMTLVKRPTEVHAALRAAVAKTASARGLACDTFRSFVKITVAAIVSTKRSVTL